MKAIVAVDELGANRYQTHGRIRLGDRGGKNRAPRSLPTFRITSPDEEAVRQIAAIYGGEPRQWSDKSANPPDQWEVVTKATELRVFLPPGALSCWYELWSGGGCIRRCDGRACEVAQHSGDEAEMVSVPCLCKQENGMLCKPHSRLSVVLPEIRFGGVFRLETSGWQAARELPAMQSLIESLQEHGVIEAVLALEKAQAQQGRKRYVIPRLRLSKSAEALAQGQASVGALHSGSSGLLGLPAPSSSAEPGDVSVAGVAGNGGDWYDQDDEIVDAEVVGETGGDEPGDSAPPVDAPVSPSNGPRTGALTAAETKFLLECNTAAEFVEGVDGDWVRHALARKVSRGRVETSRSLTSDELSAGIEAALSLSSETHRGKVTRRVPPTLKIEPRLPV